MQEPFKTLIPFDSCTFILLLEIDNTSIVQYDHAEGQFHCMLLVDL